MRILPTLLATALFTLAACAAPAPRVAPKTAVPLAEAAPASHVRPCAQAPTTPARAFECDRKSILAMAGQFRVRFAFDETAALAPGYVPHAAQRSGGTEWVEVIADSGEHISLQHILVVGKDHTVVKHWRQDWQYQPTQVVRFRGNGRFETQALADAAAAGNWSQTVYEVDDAPRYAGVGRWTHTQGEDAWQSDRTWRPLPRREYTKRFDYQALEVVNRHTLTPAGWVHEQDNTKLVLDASGNAHAIAREVGLNSYTRISDYDFTAARDYWTRTAPFWAEVRAQWDRFASTHAAFTISPEPNGEPRIDEFFTLAAKVEVGQAVSAQDIQTVFERYVRTNTAR